MVALKAGDVDAFVAKPSPARPIVLVYGPDNGLVHERAEAIIRASVDDPADPFALTRLEGDDLAGDPARLVDEAGTIPLFGGRRAIWVRTGSRNMVPAVETLIAAGAGDCRVVIEAGDLKKSAPLRAECEKAAQVAVIACYADDERGLARLIDTEMQAAGLTIAADARAALVPLLGGDRSASRSELRKLALYAAGTGRVELDDVLAVVADASSLVLDSIVDAAFAGRPAEVEAGLAKARVAGTAPGTIVSAASRQCAALHRAAAAMNGGSASQAVEAMVPPVHFRRKPLVEAALKTWTETRLLRTMGQLADATLDIRLRPALGETLAARAMLSLAVNARRRNA